MISTLEAVAGLAARAYKTPHRVGPVFGEVMDRLSLSEPDDFEAQAVLQALRKHYRPGFSSPEQLALALTVVAALSGGPTPWALNVVARQVLKSGDSPAATAARALIRELHPSPDQASGETYLDPLMQLEQVGDAVRSGDPVAPKVVNLLQFPPGQGPSPAQISTLPALTSLLGLGRGGQLAQYSKLLGASLATLDPQQASASQHAHRLESRLDPEIFGQAARRVRPELSLPESTGPQGLQDQARQLFDHWSESSRTALESQRRRQLYQGLAPWVDQPQLRWIYDQGHDDKARPWALALLAAADRPQEEWLRQASQSMLSIDDRFSPEGMRVFRDFARRQGTPWQEALCQESDSDHFREVLSQLSQGQERSYPELRQHLRELVAQMSASLADPALRSAQQFAWAEPLRTQLPLSLRAQDLERQRQGQSPLGWPEDLLTAFLPQTVWSWGSPYEPGQAGQVKALAALLTMSAILDQRQVPRERLLQACSAQLLLECQKPDSPLGNHLKLQGEVSASLQRLSQRPWQKHLLQAPLSLEEKLKVLAQPPRWSHDRVKEGLRESLLARPWGTDASAHQQRAKIGGFQLALQGLMGPFPFWKSCADVARHGLINGDLLSQGLQPTYLALHDLVEHGLLGRATNPSADLVPTFCYQVDDYPLMAGEFSYFRKKHLTFEPGPDWKDQVRRNMGPPLSKDLTALIFLEHLSDQDLQRAESENQAIVDKVKRAVVGDNIATAEREIVMVPWLLQALESLRQGHTDLPPIPEEIQSQLAQLHQRQSDNPQVFQDYTREQAQDLKQRLVAAKGPVYARAESILEEMDQAAQALALHQRRSAPGQRTFAHLQAQLS